jgi:hypothetical protein
MVMAIFLKWSPFRYNGGEVKVVLGRAGCEDYVELPHVRVALQFPVYLYVYVHSFPHFPASAVLRSTEMVVAIFFEVEPFQAQSQGESTGDRECAYAQEMDRVLESRRGGSHWACDKCYKYMCPNG